MTQLEWIEWMTNENLMAILADNDAFNPMVLHMCVCVLCVFKASQHIDYIHSSAETWNTSFIQ